MYVNCFVVHMKKKKNDSQKNFSPKESNTDVTNSNAKQVMQIIKVN